MIEKLILKGKVYQQAQSIIEWDRVEINENWYKYLSQIKFKKLGNDGFSLAYSGLKSPIPNENNMG